MCSDPHENFTHSSEHVKGWLWPFTASNLVKLVENEMSECNRCLSRIMCIPEFWITWLEGQN